MMLDSSRPLPGQGGTVMPNRAERRHLDRLATRTEVAEYLKVAPRTLENWAYRRIGPPFTKANGRPRYRWSDVEAWLSQQQVGGGAA